MKEIADDIFNEVAEEISQIDALRNDIIYETNEAKTHYYTYAITFNVSIWSENEIDDNAFVSTVSSYIEFICSHFILKGKLIKDELKCETWYGKKKYYFKIYYYYSGEPFYGIRQIINFISSFFQSYSLPQTFVNKMSFGKIIFNSNNNEDESSKNKINNYITIEEGLIRNLYQRRFYNMDSSQMYFGNLCDIAMKLVRKNISWYDSLMNYLGDEIDLFKSMLDSYLNSKISTTYKSRDVHRWVKPILDAARLSGNNEFINKKSEENIHFYNEEDDEQKHSYKYKIANIQYIYLQDAETLKSTSYKMNFRDIDKKDKGRKILSWKIVSAYPSDVMFGYLGLCRKMQDGIEQVWIEMLVIDPNPHARDAEFSTVNSGYLLGHSIDAVISEKLPKKFCNGFLYDEVENNIKERHEKYVENMEIIDREIYKIKRGIW